MNKRLLVRLLALSVACAAVLGAFLISPYWMNDWEVPLHLYVGSALGGIWCASTTLFFMEMFKIY